METENGRRKILSRYNITDEFLEALILQTEGRCEACGDATDRMNIDHNHETGFVRGLLCTGCNVVAGALENPNLDRVADYLRRKGDGERITRETPIEKASSFLAVALAVGPRLGSDVLSEAAKAGLSVRTVFKAKLVMKVSSTAAGKRAIWALSTAA